MSKRFKLTGCLNSLIVVAFCTYFQLFSLPHTDAKIYGPVNTLTAYYLSDEIHPCHNNFKNSGQVIMYIDSPVPINL